jgi:hypothetical protein
MHEICQIAACVGEKENACRVFVGIRKESGHPNGKIILSGILRM